MMRCTSARESPVLGLQRLDLSQLLTGRALTASAVDIGLNRPATHGLLAEPELLGHHRRSSRQGRVLTAVVLNQTYSASLELVIDLLRHGAHLLDSNRSGIKPG